MATPTYDNAKRDILLGQSVQEQVKAIDDNFTDLFDNDEYLLEQINTKQDKITAKTAFNKDFLTDSSKLKMDGAASVGDNNDDTVAKGTHRHPTDTTRLAAAPYNNIPLIDSGNKIDTRYLPDVVVGQLKFIDAFNASMGKPVNVQNYVPQKGDYFICQTGGNLNPDGTVYSTNQRDWYAVGDWAVCQSVTDGAATWDKIDNTDLVTSVNDQIGAVKTYKGAFQPNTTTYYSGDIVLYNEETYICISGAPMGEFDSTKWQILGRKYDNATPTADGLMSAADKTKLNGIAEGANKTIVDSALSASSTNPVQNKAVKSAIDTINTSLDDKVDKVAGKGLSTNDFTTEEKNKLSTIGAGASVNSVNGQKGYVELWKGVVNTWTAGVYKAGDMISYKGTIYVCISDTTAADSAPDLSNKWQSTGKVQGITVNGNEVPITNGIAAITLADLSVGYTTILAGANEWGDYELNGTKYNAIRLAQGTPEVGVFVDNNGVESEIVCQRVVANNVLYLCVNKQDTSKANNGQPAKVVVRVVGGSSVGGGSSAKTYKHIVQILAGGGTGAGRIVIYSTQAEKYTQVDDAFMSILEGCMLKISDATISFIGDNKLYTGVFMIDDYAPAFGAGISGLARKRVSVNDSNPEIVWYSGYISINSISNDIVTEL